MYIIYITSIIKLIYIHIYIILYIYIYIAVGQDSKTQDSLKVVQ